LFPVFESGYMSESSGTDEWTPTFPWDRAGKRLRATETGRFVVFNAVVFGLVGVAFVLQPIVNAIGGGREVSRVTIAVGPTPPDTVALAFGAALAFSPLLAVVSGVLAGLFLRPTTGAKAATAAAGVAAGGSTLLVLFFGTAILLGIGVGAAGVDVVPPILSTAGAIVVGAGTAVVTKVCLPTRPAE
jgi:hypothetical protein